jgi:RNA polymerase sigma factor (sigma-70 family)
MGSGRNLRKNASYRLGAKPVETSTQEVRALLQRCIRGEPEAQTAFQEAYGALIYSFPVRIHGLGEAEAGDFYLYAFESGRVFKRAQTFEGRHNIQFTNYLSFYVLRDLLYEWLRTRREVETVSLDAAPSVDDPRPELSESMGERVFSTTITPEESLLAEDRRLEIVRALETLDEEKRLLIKLLCLADFDLEPGDVRSIARISGRGIRETLQIIDDIEQAMGKRAIRWRERQEKVTTVHAWIMTYQRRLRQLDEHLDRHVQPSQRVDLHGLEAERDDLRRKLAWRYRQQASLQREAMAVHIRPSYKELVRLLDWPLGSVCSRVARAREALSQTFEQLPGEHSSAGE